MHYKDLISRFLGGGKAPHAASPPSADTDDTHAGHRADWQDPPGHRAWAQETPEPGADVLPATGEPWGDTAAVDADGDPGIIAGRVEHLSAEGASGWAFDAAQPGKPVAVAAFLGATRLAHTLADAARDDLGAEIGGGVLGFSLAFSPAVSEDLLEHVQILAASAGIPQVLHAREPAAAAAAVRHAVAEVAPIFVIGVAPDAAEILTRGLAEAMGLPGHGEGQFLPLAQSLIRMTNQFYRTAASAAGPHALIRQVQAGKVHEAIRTMFAGIMAELHPEGDWIDNTQGLAGIRAVPVLRATWPRARFIFVSSRVIESVGIGAAGEPSHRLSERVNDWVRDMQSWLEIRDRFRHSSLTVDRQSLLHEPAAASVAIGELLKLDGVSQARLGSVLTEVVRASGLPAPKQGVDSSAGWDGEAGEALRAASDATMTAYSYVWDTAYFAASPAPEEAST